MSDCRPGFVNSWEVASFQAWVRGLETDSCRLSGKSAANLETQFAMALVIQVKRLNMDASCILLRSNHSKAWSWGIDLFQVRCFCCISGQSSHDSRLSQLPKIIHEQRTRNTQVPNYTIHMCAHMCIYMFT